jgi:FKBP-type peptidyl-prolyl cis-trans isomerase (trigger factor)
LNDEFVKKNYNLENVNAYYTYVENTILGNKQAEGKSKSIEEFLNQLKKCFEFEIADEVILDHALTIYNDFSNNPRIWNLYGGIFLGFYR